MTETSEPQRKKPTVHEVRTKKTMEETLHGGRVRAGHRASLFGILGERYMIPIRSAGKRFFMIGSFPYRSAIAEVAKFSSRNRKQDLAPTRDDYRNWADQFNRSRVAPSIQIASTSNDVTRRTYMALIGGANHEGFHRLYSGQCPIRGLDLEGAIAPHYNSRIPYYEKETLSLLMESQNIFEDIRIERIGCAEFPGVYTKMADLADFILDQEEEIRKRDRDKAPSPSRIALAVFREVGLGYSTIKTRAALAHYNEVCPEVVELIRSGSLASILKEVVPDVSSEAAIRRAKSQMGLSTALAFGFLNLLYDLTLAPTPEQKRIRGSEGDPSEGGSEIGDGKGDKPEGFKEESEGGEATPSSGDEEDPEDGEDQTEEKQVASDILNSDPQGLKDYASALEEIVEGDLARDDDKLKEGERPYRPYTTSEDRVVLVSGREKEGRIALAKVVAETKRETAYLRSKLRNLFKALESGDRIHGVRKGRVLSERYLVDTYATILGGKEPRRAFIEETEVIDTSISAFVVLDESGSMSENDKPVNTPKILYTLSDGLESIGAKFAISGFRNGKFDRDLGEVDWKELTEGDYHRVGPITYDVFKGFEERYSDVAWRLGNLTHVGSTPMADGIEFGLRALSNRKEGHRVLFIITDGEPDDGHGEVILGQIRRAKEAGVHLIGVGLGSGSESVQTLFADHVFSLQLREIPSLLVKKLGELVFEIGTSKRGKLISKE